jgi:hydroxypyruvate isomerase
MEPDLSANEGSSENSQNRHFTWSLAWWCHRMEGSPFDADRLCGLANHLGVKLDLVEKSEWKLVNERDVKMGCMLPEMTMADGLRLEPFVPGFNDPQYADGVHKVLSSALDLASQNGIASIIVFTGMGTNEDESEQYDKIVKGFIDEPIDGRESLIKKAERLQVTFMMEMLNTNGDEKTWRGHPGYLGNSTNKLVEKVIKRVNSSRLRLAFDIYHVAMMREDPLEMIENHHEFIGNVQVAGMTEGNANRGEITAEGQMIRYADVFSKLREKLPGGGKGIPVLLEYIPSSKVPETVRYDLASAINVCESI